MRMRPRAGEKRDGAAALFALSVAAAVCDDHFASVWNVGAPEADRACEVRSVVVRDVSAGGDSARLADVSVFAVTLGDG